MKKTKKHEPHDSALEVTEKELQEVSTINPHPKRWKGLVITLAIILAIPLLAVLGLYGYQYAYQDKVYEGVYVGPYAVGGLTRSEVTTLLEKVNKKFGGTGVTLQVTTASGSLEKISFPLQVTTRENTLTLAQLDGKTLSTQAFSYGRQGPWYEQLITPITLLFLDHAALEPTIVFNSEIFRDRAREVLAPYENPSHNAGIAVTSLHPFEYQLTPEKSGTDFNYAFLEKELRRRLATFSFEPIALSPQPTTPTITRQDVEKAALIIPTLLADPITLIHEEASSTQSEAWKLSPAQLSKWLVPLRTSSTVTFGVDPEQVKSYLQANISKYIDREAQSAVFRREGERVVEFKGSTVGMRIDTEKTAQHITDVLVQRQGGGVDVSSTTIAVTAVQPAVSVAQANDLGITDIVGVGVSTFKDSHTNRIKNIANAIKRLNGTLIKPGEVFSTNKYAGPYTKENGFFPEMVIKGDKIIPEVGGGMCQVGTTMFRMAMNAGMDITERANHSLVVSYYADPVNNNPGTDATLYDPILDLKFANDTGNYLLLQTDIDYNRQQLTFTLWGKPDGRKGSYTHPEVSQWISPGPAREIPVTTLPVGEKKCQSAYRGAVASFMYTRFLPSGEKVERVFESRYRALPQICMVGAADTVPSDPLVDTSPVVDTLAPTN